MATCDQEKEKIPDDGSLFMGSRLEHEARMLIVLFESCVRGFFFLRVETVILYSIRGCLLVISWALFSSVRISSFIDADEFLRMIFCFAVV